MIKFSLTLVCLLVQMKHELLYLMVTFVGIIKRVTIMIKNQLSSSIIRTFWSYEKINFPSKHWKVGNSCLGKGLTGCRVKEKHDTGSIGEVRNKTIISINGRVSGGKNKC